MEQYDNPRPKLGPRAMDLTQHPDILRLSRAVTFADELLRKLRARFAVLEQNDNRARSPYVQPFLDRIATLAEAVARSQQLLVERADADLRRFEPELRALFEAAKGLEAMGENLRNSPALAQLFPVPTGPAAARGAPTHKVAVTTPLDAAGLKRASTTPLFETGKKTLRQLFQQLTGTGDFKPLTPEAAQSRQIRADLIAILERDQQLIDFVTPRMQLLSWAVQVQRSFPARMPRLTMASQLPAKLQEHQVPDAQAESVMVLINTLNQHPEALKLSMVSLNHFETACQVLEEIRLFLEAAAGMEDAEVVRMGASFNIKQLNGATYQLWHLDQTFKGYPALSLLFPKPSP